MLSRRRFIVFFVCVTLALTLSGCEWLADKPISIGAYVWPGYEPMFLARNKGWLDAQQVRLVETTSTTDSLKALAEGKVDGAALTLDEVLQARASGLPLSVVMIFDISAGSDMVVARSDIKNLADLKGRRIGFEQGAVGDLMLAEALREAGLTKEEVTLVSLPVDQQLAAWSHDQLDAAVTYEPVASQLLAQGALKVFDSGQIPNLIVDVLAIRNDVLDRIHAKAIRHLIVAHFRALKHLSRNPQDAAYRMAPRLGLPAANLLSIFKGLVLPDAAENYRLLAGTSPELLASARNLSTIMVKNKLLEQDAPLTSLIRADFLPTDFQ
ncbi:MAG: ABC transporter substrate-binding protein [Desulfurivibrionaceae bacterium]|jgi:NitT/TauT family transport system substrate-binding protein